MNGLLRCFVVGGLMSTSLAFADIEGVYKSGCDSLDAVSLKRTIEFGKDQSFVFSQLVHADLECATPAYTFDYIGNYEMPAKGQINWIFKDVYVTPTVEPIAQIFNESELCGITTWTAGIASLVTNLECDGQIILTSGSVFYDIMREVEGGIQLGLATDEETGSSPETRPTEFEETIYLKE